MIQVTIDGKGYEYPENCSYYEIAKDFEKTMDAPIVLVKVDGRLRELHKQLKKDCELEFVTTEDEIGHKTYQRSLSLLLVKAVYHVGGYDKIRHVMLHFSAGSGVCCTSRSNRIACSFTHFSACLGVYSLGGLTVFCTDFSRLPS